MSEAIKIVMDKNDLQPLADEVKKLRGGNEPITLAQMENELLSVNDEVDVQAELLVQIAAALEGKAAGNGGTDTADNFFVVQIFYGEDIDYIETYPFKTGMTWKEYINSYLCPIIGRDLENLVCKFESITPEVDDENGIIEYWLHHFDGINNTITHRSLSPESRANDIIQGYENGFSYTVYI